MSRRNPHPTATLAVLLALMLGSVPATTASAGLGAALEALLTHVPENHRDACRPDLALEREGTVISVRCELPSGLFVRYTQLDSPEALAAAYRLDLQVASVVEDTGDCSEAAPGEEPYTSGGEPAGRLACYRSFGFDTFEWTHEATKILGEAQQEARESNDVAGLWAWWSTESGPLDPAADSPETGLGAALEALLLQVPESHRATCHPAYGGKPEDGHVVALRCDVSSDLSVIYDQLDSPEALAAAYQRVLDAGEVTESSGDCSQALPGEESYTIGGQPAGRLLCREYTIGGIQLTWTHQPTSIMATAFSKGDMADLWEWWLHESGPIG